MADIPVSLLPAATELDDDDILVGNADGTTVAIPMRVLRSVLALLGVAGLGNVRTATADTTVSEADIGGLVIVTATSPVQVTFPASNATLPVGASFRIRQGGTAPATFSFPAPSGVDDQQTGRARTNGPGDEAIVTKVGAQDWTIRYSMAGARGAFISSSDVTYNLIAPQNTNKVTRFTNNSAITATLRTVSNGSFNLGDVVTVRQAGDGQVTITPEGTATINIPDGKLAKTRAKGSVLMLHLVDTASGGVWDLTGDLAAA